MNNQLSCGPKNFTRPIEDKYSQKPFCNSLAHLLTICCSPLYLQQLFQTKLISSTNYTAEPQQLWFNFFFIVPKSIGLLTMSKQSIILYLTGSTGQVKQYAPFNFMHCAKTFWATFYQLSLSDPVELYSGIDSGLLIYFSSSGRSIISCLTSSIDRSLAQPFSFKNTILQVCLGYLLSSFFLSVFFQLYSTELLFFPNSLAFLNQEERQSTISVNLSLRSCSTAVFPFESVMVTSAPFSTRRRAISKCLTQQRGVWPANLS